MRELTEAELLAKLRGSRRQAAYAELYRRHRAAAHGAARRIAPELDADDIVAEAFARILQTVRNGAGPKEMFRPYLYEVIRNLCIAQGKERALAPVSELDDVADPKTATDFGELLELREQLAEAFERLPERWRTVFWYTEVEGISVRETADLLGTSPNNISQTRRRARLRLQQELEQIGANLPRRAVAVAMLGATSAAIFPQHFSSAGAHAAGAGAAGAAGTAGSGLGLSAKIVGTGFFAMAAAVGLFFLSIAQPDEQPLAASPVVAPSSSPAVPATPSDQPELDDSASGATAAVAVPAQPAAPTSSPDYEWVVVPQQEAVVRGPQKMR